MPPLEFTVIFLNVYFVLGDGGYDVTLRARGLNFGTEGEGSNPPGVLFFLICRQNVDRNRNAYSRISPSIACVYRGSHLYGELTNELQLRFGGGLPWVPEGFFSSSLAFVASTLLAKEK